MKNKLNKLLIILGPTSTGKTDLGLLLAKKFNGELVSADSRQVYKGLDIGTGKMPGNGKLTIDNGQLKKGKRFWEINGIKVWMYDVVSPKRQYNVANYVKDAQKVINKIIKKGRLPIVVGGTGLYIKALIEGLPSLSLQIDKKLRGELGKLSLKDLQTKLVELSVEKWESMNYSDQQNPRRLIRAIETVILSPSNSLRVNSAKDFPRMWDSNKLRPARHQLSLQATAGGDSSLIVQNDRCVLKIGLTSTREILYKRSDDRVISRMKQGLIGEAQSLKNKGISLKRFRQLGLEYGVLADYLEGRIKSVDSLIANLQLKIHGYIKRQQTWFKNPTTYSGYINWFDISEENYISKIEKLVRKWYD